MEGDIDYLRLFLFGVKSDIMKDVEKENPTMGKFKRRDAFFHAFNITINFERGWLIILPARHAIEWRKNNSGLTINCILFALLIRDKLSSFPRDVREIVNDRDI